MDPDIGTNSVDEFNTLGIKEVLDQDSRPTFIIDLDPDDEVLDDGTTLLHPVFCNSALQTHERLLDAVIGNDAFTFEKQTYEDFRTWATGVTKFDDSKDIFPLSFLYGGMMWTGSTVRQRWRLISGNLLYSPASIPLHDLSSGPPNEVATGGLRIEQLQSARKSAGNLEKTQTNISIKTGSSTLVSSQQKQTSKLSYYPSTADGSSDDTANSADSKKSITLEKVPEKAVPDWTAAKPKGVLSPHVSLARTIDWATTPLGAMETWSPEFRQVANLCMGNPHPHALFWGSELTMLYNEAYAVEVAGNKHPTLMGTGFSGPFSEIWDAVGPLFAECARTGISVRKENDYLPIERHGFVEECFFSWSFTPLYGGTNRIVGFNNAPFETTKQVLSHRRMQTINKVGEHVSLAKTIKQFWKCLLDGLQHNHFDVPFALLYSVGDGEDEEVSTSSSGSTMSLKSCHLEGSIGIPEGHPAAPRQLDLKRSREGFIPSFRTSMRTREPTILHTRDGTLPEGLLEGIEWRGFGDPCREAIIFPVRPTNGESVLAFLLLGVNPRRPYDDEYKAFTSMLNRQLATSLASTILFEEEIRRSRDAAEAAALEQEQLSQQLAVQTSRLRRMTELSPLGMFNISPDGVIREANDRYYEMTGHPRDAGEMYEFSWLEHVMENSRQTMLDGWHRMVVEHLPFSGEIELKKISTMPVDLNGEPIDYWVLSTAQPEFASDGSLRSIMGSITDISHLKWAQGLQNQRLKEAEETRRQQNEFIDVTCHEIRNPLSAILQCADDISLTLNEYHTKGIVPSQAVVENCMDAANTITLCVQHQKAIVDDILTVSKLDSNLLAITPVTVQPIAIAKRAVKMFDAELQAKDIKAVFKTDPDLQELKVDWMILDPSRVLQILINLMTNAIKFTATSTKRVITVSIGVSRDPPTNINVPGFQYVPCKLANVNPTTSEDWGTGEVLYLHIKVKDTGCGLTPDEMQLLFKRFSQASPRTHAQYGGSGLGLYICRQLAELHGGQIGVASEAGVGSTFGFFLMARQSGPPLHSAPRQNLPMSPEIGGDVGVSQRVEMQAQDVATVSPVLSMKKLESKVDPKLLDILVVEDNLVNQRILVQQLKKVGSAVSVANDGLEALDFLEETHFRRKDGKRLSVILMDLEMPNMDGLTCVSEIRKMEKEGKIERHVPVIAVTANVRDGQIAAAMESGMDDVVSKPFRIPDLLLKIELLLSSLGDGDRVAGAGM